MPLKRVCEIEICGERFDLAKNGRFTLVRTSPDAYGEPRGEEVDINAWIDPEWTFRSTSDGIDRFRAVLDLLGQTIESLAQARAMRLGGEPGDQP